MTTNNLYNTIVSDKELTTKFLKVGKEIMPCIKNIVDLFIMLGYNTVKEMLNVYKEV
jgi:hypothetical protein